MGQTVFDVLKDDIRKEIEPVTKAQKYQVGINNFEEYTKSVGKIAGLELALRIVEDLEDRQINE